MVYMPAAMSLLTPTEAHAFQSFLTSMDHSDSFIPPEWNKYGIVNDAAIKQTAGKESLTKATKDLMSLDAIKWSNPPRQSQSPYDESSSHSLFHNIPSSQHTQHLISPLKPQNQPLLYAHHRPHSPSISITPLSTVSAPSPPHPDDVPSSSSSPASVPMSASPPTPFEYYPPQPSASKRPSQDESHRTSNKRFRHSSSQPTTTPPPKPALLSASQKKANHIQSEQKRRANIRKGYEALCETVPALREAIRLEEEANGTAAGNGDKKASTGSRGKKKAKGKLLSDDGEKIDGRAGPRSENVVLQKTIDYIEELLTDRTELLARLNAARNSLARGHPLLNIPGRESLWEQEWTGGEGAEEDDDDDDE